MSQIGGQYGSRYFSSEQELVMRSRLVALSVARRKLVTSVPRGCANADPADGRAAVLASRKVDYRAALAAVLDLGFPLDSGKIINAAKSLYPFLEAAAPAPTASKQSREQAFSARAVRHVNDALRQAIYHGPGGASGASGGGSDHAEGSESVHDQGNRSNPEGRAFSITTPHGVELFNIACATTSVAQELHAVLWKVNVHAGYLKTSKIKKERELEQAAQSPAAEEEKHPDEEAGDRSASRSRISDASNAGAGAVGGAAGPVEDSGTALAPAEPRLGRFVLAQGDDVEYRWGVQHKWY
ncbi:unnamed protein product, partial [Ectocarpus fasciculatus]